VAVLPFVVDTTDPTAVRVEVAGVDVSGQVSRVVLDATANEMPKLMLQARIAGGVVEGVADVTQLAPADVDEISVIVGWLDNLDPALLERAILDDFEGTTGESTLRVLRRWASGG
jgi:hypothetical protein